MVKKTRCVITLAGPYHLYGSKLIKACAENGVHCLDLTGEPTWSCEMMQKHGEAAKRTKAIFIHGAGFDSVPGDIGTLLAVKKLQSATSSPCGLVASGYRAKGGFSGGTFSTMLVLSEMAAQDEKHARNMRDPYLLSPIRGQEKPGKPFFTFTDAGNTGAYYLMAPANEPVVRQSWGLLEEAKKSNSGSFSYGSDFKYKEFLVTGNRFVAGLISFFTFSFGALLFKSAFARRLAKKWGLQAGDGPSEQVMQNGWMNVQTVARSVDGKTKAKATFKARGDPGYLATSIMICESALGIVHDYDRLTDLAKEGGHLTSATVFGPDVLKERLEQTGRFDISVELL